jgi:hypothetical protein
MTVETAEMHESGSLNLWVRKPGIYWVGLWAGRIAVTKKKISVTIGSLNQVVRPQWVILIAGPPAIERI